MPDLPVPPEVEVPLTGGNVTAGLVRVGQTVRRPQTPYAARIRGVLAQLEHAGVEGVPRYLGTDDQGREVVSYLPGSTDFPADMLTNPQVVVAATGLLRRYHDATTGLVAAADGWAYSFADTARHEVICHNDFAPYNLLFEGGVPTGIIDFDLAGPGPRLRDVAYLAYWLSPLSFSGTDMTPAAQAEVAAGCPRLRLLCDTYGVPADAELLAMVDHVLSHMGSHAAARGMIGEVAAQRLAEGGHFDHWQAEHASFRATRAEIDAALGTKAG